MMASEPRRIGAEVVEGQDGDDSFNSILRRNRGVLLAALIGGAVAQCIPFALGPEWRSRQLFGDEINYWNLASHGLFNFLRPPGYPALIAMVRRAVGPGATGVFILQSLVASIRPVLLVGVLATAGIRRRSVLMSAALVCATSLTAMSLSKRLLADSLLGIILPACFLALWLGSRRDRWPLVAVASLLAACGLLLKPIFELWIVLAPALIFAFGARGGKLMKWSGIAICLPIAVFVAWSAVMYSCYGVFTYSGMGVTTADRYLGSATVALGRVGASWNDAAVRESQEERKPQWEDILYDRVTAARFSALKADTRSILIRNVPLTVYAAGVSTWRNLPRPFFVQELVTVRRPTAEVSTLGKVLTYMLWLLAAFGAIVAWRGGSRRLVIALLLTWLAFQLSTSVSFGEGARLMFPVEWILFALLGFALDVANSTRGFHPINSCGGLA